MKIQTGAILLIAGTCIGSGMIALPLVLAKLGIFLSIALMLLIWFVMYYTSLINLELNLQAGQGLTLGSLGRLFSGTWAETIGIFSLKLLSYSLLAVFIYGGASILKELLLFYKRIDLPLNSVASLYALVVILLLLLPINLIDYLNRFLFVGLIAIVGLFIVGLTFSIDWFHLPLYSDRYNEISTWTSIIPVVFTSFGFQVIFQTLTNYCKKDPKTLKQAFFWGSLIPAIVYILWTCTILSAIFQNNPGFYHHLVQDKVEVGELIQALSSISKWQSVQLSVWLISSLAIATSVLGVGVGLSDAIKSMIKTSVQNLGLKNLAASILAVLPAYLVVIFVPNAFIAVLGFAGLILAVIAILLPAYLFKKANFTSLFYPELKMQWLIAFSVVFGIIVIVSELYNIFV